MPRIRTNGIEIEYESFGDGNPNPILLIMGLGAQMTLWDEEFCGLLVGHGHRVIRFDNRDVGLSTKLGHLGVPPIQAVMESFLRGDSPSAPYTLSDMARDAAELLEELDIEAAHVVGASMGGMIAQTLTLEHPERVRTLTSIMSSTGNPKLPGAKPEAIALLMTPTPPERDAYIERSVTVARVLRGPGFPFDEEYIRARAARLFDRSFYPEGFVRQLAAIMASGSRRDSLEGVKHPTLVIHGDTDPLVPIEGGIDTADAVPGADLVVIEGMGHDLPRPVWPRIADAIVRHAKSAPGLH
jgi:pimeloyl-ACP methyl ester carboxylesterase